MSLKIKRPAKKNLDRPLTQDYTNDFIAFMAEHGMEPDPRKGLVIGGDIGLSLIHI